MSDALDRLKKRSRPKVTPRDASLSSTQDIQTSGHIEQKVSETQDTQISQFEAPVFPDISQSRYTDAKMSETQDAQTPRTENPTPPDISQSRHTDVKMSETQDVQTFNFEDSMSPDISESRHIDTKMSETLVEELQTKRSTFRLEAALIDRLHSFCRGQGLSREVFIEAMYEYMERHPEAMGQVVKSASQKHQYRQQMANRKRAEAMMQKFGGA